jgi:hypothetical protein
MASLGYAAPQLPIHAVILNMTERENVSGKQVRACSRARCSCHRRYITAVRSELALHLEKLGNELKRESRTKWRKEACFT